MQLRIDGFIWLPTRDMPRPRMTWRSCCQKGLAFVRTDQRHATAFNACLYVVRDCCPERHLRGEKQPGSPCPPNADPQLEEAKIQARKWLAKHGQGK